MKENRNDWLNNFIERNAWGILLALVGVTIAYTVLRTQVLANENKIRNIEQAQIVIIENQKSIIELQVNQANLATDVNEIKADVKTLLLKEK